MSGTSLSSLAIGTENLFVKCERWCLNIFMFKLYFVGGLLGAKVEISLNFVIVNWCGL